MSNLVASSNRNLLVGYLPALIAALAGLAWWLFDAGLMIYWHDRAAVDALLPEGEPAARRFAVAIAIAGAAFLGAFARNFALRDHTGRAAPVPAQPLDESGAQDALRRTREKYLELFEQMPDGVFRSCRDGTVLSANPALVRMLGYASERDLCEHVNLFDLFLFGEQRDNLLEQLDLDGQAHNVELDLKRKDLTEVVVKANVIRVPGGPQGELLLQGTLADITDLREASDALRDSEEHFRAVADNTADLIAVIDENARILYCSPASQDLLGYQPCELNGRSGYDLVHPEDVDAAREAIVRLFATPGARTTFEFRARHKERRYVAMESAGSAFVDSKGRMRGVVSTRDVSTKRREQDRQTRLQKLAALGQLTGGIAHDFNNLLTVIVGCLQLIDDAHDDAELGQQVELAMRAAMRGSELNRQLLAFARCQPLKPRPTRLAGLLDNVEPALRSTLGPKIVTRIDCPDDAWRVEVDREQLEHAILSLARNAAEACNGRGNVTISASNVEAYPSSFGATDPETGGPREYLLVAVTDDGCGMTPAVRKRAVDPFFTTSQNTNSGLGLSMVYGFARQSGGFLQLSSAEGEGTSVKLFLPRRESRPETFDAPQRDRIAPGGNERVLIVDDDKNVLTSVSELVRDLGYEVVSADSADAALQILERSGADLLFSDIRMPGMSGIELALLVRNEYPETRIILTSGFTNYRVLPDGEHVDGFDFIPKPYRKQSLAERIRAALDRTS